MSSRPSKTPRATPHTVQQQQQPTRAPSAPVTQFIVAVVEFRNRSTVGIAAMDLQKPSLILTQFSDNQMYSNALMLLNQYDPCEILMSDTATGSALFNTIKSEVCVHVYCSHTFDA